MSEGDEEQGTVSPWRGVGLGGGYTLSRPPQLRWSKPSRAAATPASPPAAAPQELGDQPKRNNRSARNLMATPALRPEMVAPPVVPRTADDFTFGELLIGLVGLGVLGLIAYGLWQVVRALWWVFDQGSPASGLCLLALVAWVVLVMTAAITKLDKRAERSGIIGRIVGSLMDDATRWLLWTGIGLALVWLAQVSFFRRANLSGPEHAADLQLRLYDLADALKGAFSSEHYALMIGGALAISLVLKRLWPINLAAIAKKWLGRVAAVLIAATSMSFVAANTGAARYQDGFRGPITAQVLSDLAALRTARQEHAALQWLRASLERSITSPEDARAWQDYLRGAVQICGDANRTFEKAYVGDDRYGALPEQPFCDQKAYITALAIKQVKRPVVAAVESDPAQWLHEFRDLRPRAAPGGPEGQPAILAGQLPTRKADWEALRKRARNALESETDARKGAEGAVTGILAGLLGSDGAGAAAEMMKELTGEVVKAVVCDNRERIGVWLAMRDVPLPTTMRMLLLEPELRLESPKAAISAAGGVSALVRRAFVDRYRSVATSEIAERGRSATRSHAAYLKAEGEATAAVHRLIRESGWRYRRFRGRR